MHFLKIMVLRLKLILGHHDVFNGIGVMVLKNHDVHMWRQSEAFVLKAKAR